MKVKVTQIRIPTPPPPIIAGPGVEQPPAPADTFEVTLIPVVEQGSTIMSSQPLILTFSELPDYKLGGVYDMNLNAG